MGLFIKTYDRSGKSSLVNVQNIESISFGNGGVTFVPVRGTNPNASYYPTIAYCTEKEAETIFEEIVNFMATNENGVYNAYERVRELSNARAAGILK